MGGWEEGGDMLRVLMASQPARAGWLGSTTFSTAAHGALIALAVATTGRTFTSVHEQRATSVERITYIEPARLADVMRSSDAAAARMAAKKAADAAEAASARKAAAPVMPDLSVAEEIGSKPIDIPDLAAATDLT